jgi:two-component system chemotaxis response regulator CheY
MARFLVADDSIFMRSLIKKILTEAHHTVVAEAKDGGEAIRKYLLCNPGLTMLDITMDKTTGIQALEIIKKK